LLREHSITSLYVTHDHEEALGVADRLVLIHQGRVAQAGTPAEVWRRPAGEWVARFLGFSNLLRVEIRDGRACLGEGSFPLLPEHEATQGVRTLILRSSGLARVGVQEAHLRGRVVGQSFRGSHYLAEVELNDGQRIEAELPTDEPLDSGESIGLLVRPEAVFVLPPG
jgi:thiamine transport system ATP-binding protein